MNMNAETVFDALWPVFRHFLACGLMLLAMWEPKKRKKSRPVREEGFIDAEYEEIA